MISLFNKGEIKTIVCTSSMIEGVNTAAENVFIYDRHISTQKLDRFTFDNIKGRAGRMFRHKIGRVFLYNPPPENARFHVRVPLFETDDRLVPELLVQLDDASLTPFARQRKRAITEASILPAEVLQRWAEYGVEGLNTLADHLTDDLEDPDSPLYWKGMPSFDGLRAVFDAVWDKLDFSKHDMRTPRQLAHFANVLSRNRAIRPFMDQLVDGEGLAAQSDIDRCFNFLRGAEYTFPQVLRALNDVVDAIVGKSSADYRVYAQHLQNLFLPAGLRTLDEYGVPVPLVQKLELPPTDDVQNTLQMLEDRQSTAIARLSSVERDLLYRGIALD
jgi:hypothetical protein